MSENFLCSFEAAVEALLSSEKTLLFRIGKADTLVAKSKEGSPSTISDQYPLSLSRQSCSILPE